MVTAAFIWGTIYNLGTSHQLLFLAQTLTRNYFVHFCQKPDSSPIGMFYVIYRQPHISIPTWLPTTAEIEVIEYLGTFYSVGKSEFQVVNGNYVFYCLTSVKRGRDHKQKYVGKLYLVKKTHSWSP